VIVSGTAIMRPQTQAVATPAETIASAQPQFSRQAALARSQRVAIDTPRLRGSIALTGARIDDLALVQYRETTDPKSKAIELLSPSGSPQPFYAEFGWVDGSSTNLKVPTSETVWSQQGSQGLAVGRPVTLVWPNGRGLQFRRTISVDDKYLFSIRDEVANNGPAAVALAPYALISRHSQPPISGYYLLHEGAIGVLGDQGLQEVTYKTLDEKQRVPFSLSNAWLGFTDKYWAAILLPDPASHLQAEFSPSSLGTLKTYHADYVQDALIIEPGGSASATARLFAGAKEVAILDGYDKALHLNRFDLAIDWGWFRFITKPMFTLIDAIFRLVGNFGVAILIVTLLLKLAFFPLANKSYASAAKMKALQAADATDPRKFCRRQGEATAGDHGALPQGEDQPDRRVPADADPDPGFLLALQGTVRHHRDASGAVLRLDQGSVCTGPDQSVQPVRADPLRPGIAALARRVSCDRRVAANDGTNPMGANEADAGFARPDAIGDHELDARDLHLHAGEVFRRSGDLLDLEQLAFDRSAGHRHAPERRPHRIMGQPAGDVHQAQGRRLRRDHAAVPPFAVIVPGRCRCPRP
jgi:YidC/Oxa1 family membrane protein insertase